jgi:eukaryotic-like serine/threonine-protein kinase
VSTPVDRLATALADRYRLGRELGQGGMATVYLAEDLKHGRKVAIKVLHPELSAIIGGERFLAEIRVTANLQHPHILGLIDSGDADGLLYYVMPYVAGETLRGRLVREKQLPVDDALRLTKEVASALDYAHRQGVVHRDIKPENILLQDGAALVADFGIALAVQQAGGSRMTETGMSLGTPAYMSPEQAMGERDLGPRSDVYALGAMAYEMLAGEPPFTGPNSQAIIARVLTETPAPLRPRRATVPPDVEAALLTALQKLPADRWASAREFSDALDGHGRAPRQSATMPMAAAGRAPRRAPQAMTLGLGAILAAAALWGWLRPVATGGPNRQRVVLWQHRLASVLSPGVTHIATQAAIAPDGSSIVFVDSLDGTYRLLRKLRDAREPVQLDGTEGALSPFFSPDGAWIGYVTVDGRLRKVPTTGGGSITLATNAAPISLGAGWLDDGTIVYSDDSPSLRRIPADGGNSVAVSSRFTDRGIAPTIVPLPGSRGFLYTMCPGNCAIESAVYVFDFAADSSRLLVNGAAGAWYAPTGHLLYTDRAGGLYAAAFDLDELRPTTGFTPVIDDVEPTAFALSAAGSILYSLRADASSDLVWVTRDGRSEPVDSSWHADFMYPALSPDGTSLAVSVREESTQLWIRRADGTRQKLTQDGAVSWRPAWTADGRSVAFMSNARGATGKDVDAFDLYLIPVDGSSPPSLLHRHTFGLWEVEFSHDGQWMVVRTDEAGSNSNMRARRLVGDTTLLPLLVDESFTKQAALSPDGRWLAYVSNATGQWEVYVTSFPTVTSTRLVSRGGGMEPRWAPSGRELFYKSGNRLMAVDVRPGAAFAIGAPRPLFPLTGYRGAQNRQQYDVSPDGKRFLMIHERNDPSRSHAIHVDNWFEELKAKVSK